MKSFCFIALAAICAAQELPITRLAGLSFAVKDMERTRQFYTGVMGYEEASPGAFKVNDDQFLEFSADAALQDNFRLRCVSLLTSDVGKLRAMLAKRGLAPGEVRKGEDGSLRVAVSGPGGVEIDFVQYVPGSLEAKSRGKFLGPRRVSEHLWHAGIAVDSLDAGMAFYRDKLGFKEFARGGPNNEIRWINMMMPGTHGDYIEQMVHTATPAAARHHLCFAVPDIQAAFKALQQGMPGGYKPFLAQNNHWIVNIKDLNGLRVEIMERGEAKKQ